MHSFILILANFHFLYIQTQQVYTIYIAIKVYFLLSFHIAVATYFLLISDYLLEFAPNNMHTFSNSNILNIFL